MTATTSLHAQSDQDAIRIVELQGTAELMPAGAQTWVFTQTNQVVHSGDRVRTGPNSRLMLKWSDRSVVPFGALTEIEILAPDGPDSLSGLNLIKGIVSFFHRDKPGRIRVLTHGATASVEGTEFVLKVTGERADESATLAVIDGRVRFSNAQGSLLLTNDQEAVVTSGRPPARTAGFIANNLLQWCFYYPGVLNPDDLKLSADERQALRASLDAYRAGDLLDALARYPSGKTPTSDSETIFHAALLLSVGQVEKAESELGSLSPDSQTRRLAESLRALIAAVKRQSMQGPGSPQLATELLAASYYEQSRAQENASLETALELARRAAKTAPQFGFAWERVAELEFSFGRTPEAETALNKSLELSPRNAEALALKGFLLAAQNHTAEAITWFDRAIAADSALGNAWLGRGLCRIRGDHAANGRSDLLVAAALEPQRAALRSYLGKAYADAGDDKRAANELERALQLDPSDPTAWLYAALLKQQENRVNEAIDELETSQSLNDNRQVFRSRMLLDQDKAVRGASLATMYRDAGMTDVSVQEAASAVSEDYANADAHQFLSDSYNALRDPTRFNLRYEAVWFNEWLLANLLAPVGAGQLSQTLSSQEYSKLFESDGLGFAGDSSWRSDGQYHQLASQYGTIENTAWALDLDYHHNTGVRPNNELDSVEWYSTIKQQLTPSDSLLLLTKYEDYSSGDNFQYYNFYTSYRPNYKYDEQEKPIVIGGLQHEWAPGIQTLFLGGRLEGGQEFSDVAANQYLFSKDSGVIDSAGAQAFNVKLQDELEIYDAEFSQIFKLDPITVIAGALWQEGHFNFNDSMTPNPPLPASLLPPVNADFSEPFNRNTEYGYVTYQPFQQLSLTGGLDYDDIRFPANYQSVPESSGTQQEHRLEPKAAFVWNPVNEFTLRGMYSTSLGGASADEDIRLEPTDLAGFIQTYRSIIPESVAGTLSGSKNEVLDLATELKFKTGTFVYLKLERLRSDVDRTIGAFALVNHLPPIVPITTPENYNYEEDSISLSLNQLLPDGFVVGTTYQVGDARLKTAFPGVAPGVLGPFDQQAILNQMDGYLLFNHPSGFFARFDARGYVQSNFGFSPAEPGDAFAQLDLQGGIRMFQRRAELSLGVLNITGRNYKLEPLNVYSEMPRSAVFRVQFKFQF